MRSVAGILKGVRRMTTSEKAAQKARADRLRLRIDQIKSGNFGGRPACESPRDFVERRMREIEEQNKNRERENEPE
jgi:hypothetical protein